MRQKQSIRTSRPQRRDEYERYPERSRTRNTSRKSREEEYDDYEPYAEEEYYGEEENWSRHQERPERHEKSGLRSQGQRTNGRQEYEDYEGVETKRQKPLFSGSTRFAGRSKRGNGSNPQSRSRTTPVSNRTARTSRTKRTRKSGLRGFAAMPKAEVRRIAAMGGRASHGGGRPATRKTKAARAKRSRARKS